MDNCSINIKSLCKVYAKKGLFTSKRSHTHWLHRINPFRFANISVSPQNADKFYALNNINIEILKGETIGIIGRNGSGKSTLLKILGQVIQPSKGEVEIDGSVATVLDIGLGFHPELTGIENIFLSGTLLGMKKIKIEQKIPQIIAFSELEDSIHSVVKNYSNGMYLRLAFSIALHLEADILLFDEILAAGDLEFRIKAMNAIKKAVNERKTTVLMVSHNLTEIMELCDRVLWLENGKIKKTGTPLQIVAEYIEDSAVIEEANPQPKNENNIKDIIIQDIKIHSKERGNNAFLYNTDTIQICINYSTQINDIAIDIGITLFDSSSNPVFFSSTAFSTVEKTCQKGNYTAVCEIPPELLNAGTFLVSVLALKDKKDIILRLPKTTIFKVEINENDPAKLWENKIPGPLKPNLKWQIHNKKNDNSIS
ncbi:MAG: hypothetical protein A2275_09270 [Bacteroidetes bacterium RIFOXYA12_FULL_35_11]|nr:MAG: hypothetical protein A2X01_13130 [Bacteroidetes bacterium GWF2_35_48]OFY78089.1 MAG: hypothetical protein A2275_09270 [Bacteroidetes bacterium RIFOXYA12_FULL_35_11]OFY98477.1 MAG: hypothetical protein A2491_08320 [Bacteroidetes bacterium RIFOXYC12_FULL_35_7]HBX53732.1 hypothetical protein [Bacteroidales bacterium]